MEFFKSAMGKDCAYCIVTSLHSWAVRAQPLFGQPFLSWRGEWVLSYDRLSKAIKKVASEMGLDPTRYRTHSLRIGGASMLAAAGRPDYEIQKLGRWKSLAFLEYIKVGKATFDAALAAIVNPKSTNGQRGRTDACRRWSLKGSQGSVRGGPFSTNVGGLGAWSVLRAYLVLRQRRHETAL